MRRRLTIKEDYYIIRLVYTGVEMSYLLAWYYKEKKT